MRGRRKAPFLVLSICRPHCLSAVMAGLDPATQPDVSNVQPVRSAGSPGQARGWRL